MDVPALAARTDPSDTDIVPILTWGIAPDAEPRRGPRFRYKACFIGPNVRQTIHEGRERQTPAHPPNPEGTHASKPALNRLD